MNRLSNGIIGLLFLGSLLLPRPLMFYLARLTMAKKSAEAAARFESHWLKPRFVRSMYIMTWVWGPGLIFEAALRFWLAFAWPVEQFLAISPFISYGIYFSLMGWTLWCARRLKAGGQARTSMLVHRLAYNGDVAAGSAAADFSRRERSAHI